MSDRSGRTPSRPGSQPADEEEWFVPPTTGTDAPPRPREPVIPLLREGDSEVGQPLPAPGLSVLTAQDAARLKAQSEAETAAARAEAEALLLGDPAAFTWLAWLTGPLATAFLLAALGLLGLYVGTQGLAWVQALESAPPWLRLPGYFVLVGLLALVSYAGIRLLWVYVRLRRNQHLRLAGLEELQRRTRLRMLASQRVAEARQHLMDYLRDYPLDAAKPAMIRRQAQFGLTDELRQKLTLARRDLSDPRMDPGNEIWFRLFRDRFQVELDRMAEARIHYWGQRAMVTTAVSPNGLIDTLASLYFSFVMLQELCEIYQLRVGRTGTLVLLGRVFTHAYLAGQAQGWEGFIEQQADQAFEQAFQVLGIGVGSGFASKFLGKVGAKATTGYLNRLLLLRLGHYAASTLRPVRAV